MEYKHWYESDHPVIGRIMLASDGDALTGLWFDGNQRFFGYTMDEEVEEAQLPVFDQACEWLDIYFQGKDPGPLPPDHLKCTEFRKEVCEIMARIPYGQTITYGDIAAELASRRGKKRMSAQAVGGAVGHNPVGLIIPCHRVVGAGGNLTGYGGGMVRKVALLELEGCDMSKFIIPTKGTAISF